MIIIIGIVLIEQWKGKSEGIDVAKPLARELWERERENYKEKVEEKKKAERKEGERQK